MTVYYIHIVEVEPKEEEGLGAKPLTNLGPTQSR